MRSLFSLPDPAGEMREAGGAIAVRVDSMPGRELNRIIGLYDVAYLDQLAATYEGLPYWVSLDPEAGLDRELTARGFVPDGAWQKFERGVERMQAQTDLEVSEARSRDHFAHVTRATWGLPPDAARWLAAPAAHPDWHCFVAYDGDEPVAGGLLYAQGDVGWLGVTSTLVEHRGRGAQGAILAARIDRARELGVCLLVTETGAPEEGEPGPSYRNILRAGFDPAYVRPNYVPARADAGSSSSSGSRPSCPSART